MKEIKLTEEEREFLVGVIGKFRDEFEPLDPESEALARAIETKLEKGDN